VFRGKFVAALKSAFQHGQLHLAGDLALLAQPKIFAAWLRPLFRKDWIVYSKPPFGGPNMCSSISAVTPTASPSPTIDWYRWPTASHLSLARFGGPHQNKLMTLSLDEFLRRFLLHLLPKGFVRIRHFGFLANRRRSTLLPLCFAALGTAPSQTEPETSTHESDPLWLCPKCGGL